MKAVVTAIDGIVEFLIGPARRFCPSGKSAISCPALLQKDFCFQLTQIISLSVAVPCPMRGAFRDRHGRWARDAVDAVASSRLLAWTNDADADGEVVWS